MSTTCSMSAASVSSSSVARNAATSCVGSFWMNPTVSVNSTWFPDGNRTRRVTGSRVANSLSSTSTSAPVRATIRVLLPALV